MTAQAHLPSFNDASLVMGRTGSGSINGRSLRADTYSNKGEWNATTTYKGDYTIAQGDTVSHGLFNGKKLWWWAKFYASGADFEPGYFAPQGGTSPWVLVNSLSAVANGTVSYKWAGYNGDMDGMTGLDAKLPTWRDGAEGAYSMTHDDIGAMPFEKSVLPGWKVAQKPEYSDIKQCWGVFVGEMGDNEEWQKAVKMVSEGHEMFNHSMRHTSAADQWQWFRPGQTVPAHDPSIPEEIRGLKVVGTWGDPSKDPVYPYKGDGTRIFQSPLVAIRATHYWTQNAPSSEAPGKDLGAPYGVVIEPEVTPKWGVETITLATGQKQYVKYTSDVVGENGAREGFIAAAGPTWYEAAQLKEYGGKFWQPATNAEVRDWTWEVDPTVKAGEIVKYSGSYWKAKVDKPGKAPTTTPDWEGKTVWETATYDPASVTEALKDTNGTYVGNPWSDVYPSTVVNDKGAPGFVAKVWTVKAWEGADFKDNIQDARDTINKNIYSHITTAGEYFRKGKTVEYYGYPFDAYSEVTHDSLEQAGNVGGRGGAKSGRPIPGDFFHPYRIDFDAFFVTKSDWDVTKSDAEYKYPNNPHVLLGVNEMVDSIISQKGYMIREFHAVADIPDGEWSDAGDPNFWPLNSAAVGAGGWWGGITANMLDAHYSYLKQNIDAHKLVVYTVSEVTKYRMTANASGVPTITADGGNYKLVVPTTEDLKAKYHDEISVIVSLPTAVDSLNVKYVTPDDAWGNSPRRRPRKMNDGGTIWSVSVNPFISGGVILEPNAAWEGQGVDVDTDFVVGISTPTKKVTNLNATFNGIANGRVSLKLPAGTYTANLYSAAGRLVNSVKVVSNNGVVRTGIRTDNLSTGMFILNVTANGAQVMPASKIFIK